MNKHIDPTTIPAGDRIRFVPQSGNRWWTVRASDERYIVATRATVFTGEVVYTVVDLTGWDRTYNGVKPGPVRSSLDTLGGGYDLGPDGEGCDQILAELNAGEHELSQRRVTEVAQIEVSA